MEKRGNVKTWVTWLGIVLIFSFFVGFYVSYRITEKQKNKLDIIQEIMENEWYYGIDEEDIENTLQEKMILSMEDLSKDPYTRYLTSLGSLSDTYTGIGLEISEYGEYVIINEVSSKVSYDDGLRENDIIIAINDIDVANKESNELSKLIFSNTGCVKLKVLRNNAEIEITTSVTTYNPVTVFTKEFDNKISYVRISEFNLDTAEHIENYFSSLGAQYKDLIIDLRGNPGGYISAVKDVLDLFVGSGKVVMSTVDKHGNITYIKTTDSSFYLFDEIVVLIDSMSASGAEALAAALNYHLDDKVTLYGDTTYGKGSAQKTYTFSDGTYFHYTYALWNTPAGVTINHVGVNAEISSLNEGLSSYTVYEKELDLYDYGDEVLNVQKILNYLGIYEGVMHSFMDENMVEAIKAFQSSAPSEENLEINGKWDNKTIRYLSKLMYDDKINYLNNELESVIEGLL